jgi:Tfp pilus assembly protein PilF
VRTAGKYYNLAVESYSKRRIVEAKQNLKRGLEMCPSDEKIHNFFGLIHLGEGKLQEALDSFKKALELEPKYTDAMNNIAPFTWKNKIGKRL